MPVITIRVGLILIMIGAGGWTLSDHPSLTALIPAALGTLVLLCGLASFKAGWRKHATHAALTVCLLGLFGSAPGLIKAVLWLLGTAPERPLAVQAQAATALVCIVFIVVGVRSFINARRQRQGADAKGG